MAAHDAGLGSEALGLALRECAGSRPGSPLRHSARSRITPMPNASDARNVHLPPGAPPRVRSPTPENSVLFARVRTFFSGREAGAGLPRGPVRAHICDSDFRPSLGCGARVKSACDSAVVDACEVIELGDGCWLDLHRRERLWISDAFSSSTALRPTAVGYSVRRLWRKCASPNPQHDRRWPLRDCLKVWAGADSTGGVIASSPMVVAITTI